MKKHIFLFALIWALAHQLVSAEEIVLISDAEYIEAKLAAQKEQYLVKFAPVKGAPIIDWLLPKLDSQIGVPTDIQLNFIPQESAKINFDSLKIYYGTFRLDITNRVKEAASILGNSMHLKEVKLPTGVHKLLLTITDTEGRQGIKSIELEIR